MLLQLQSGLGEMQLGGAYCNVERVGDLAVTVFLEDKEVEHRALRCWQCRDGAQYFLFREVGALQVFGFIILYGFYLRACAVKTDEAFCFPKMLQCGVHRDAHHPAVKISQSLERVRLLDGRQEGFVCQVFGFLRVGHVPPAQSDHPADIPAVFFCPKFLCVFHTLFKYDAEIPQRAKIKNNYCVETLHLTAPSDQPPTIANG